MGTRLLIFLAALGVLVWTQPSPPTQGIQLGDVLDGLDIRFPLTVSQCEPVMIYYNMTPPPYDLYILTPDRQHIVDLFLLPGIDYLEWICNIPAGDGFIVEGNFEQYYVVQPGSSSSCLHNVTKTYAYASINTSLFQSYTQRPSNTSPLSINTPFLATATIAYPTGSIPTITANPELAISSATSPVTTTLSSSSVTRTNSSSTSSVAVSSATASSHPTTSSHKSRARVIAGGVICGFAAILLIFGIVFWYTRRRRNSRLLVAHQFIATSHPIEQSESKTVWPVPASGRVASDAVTSDAVASASDWDPSSLLSDADRQTSATPLMTSKPDPVTLPFNQGTSPTLQSPDPQSSRPATADAISQLQLDTDRQAPTDTTDAAPQTQPMSPLGPGSQNDPSNMISALNVLSRLDPTERRTVVSILHNMITSETSSPVSPRQNSIRAPPPYIG